MTPFISEIIGTAILILLGGGVVANVVLNKTNGFSSGWMVITTGWALAVYVAVVISGPYSGAHINPAVSIGLAMAGKFAWKDVPSYILAQIIGAMIGAILVWMFYKNHFEATEDADSKKAVFCTAPAIRHTFTNLFSEVTGTFVLIFTILYFSNASINDTNTIIGLGSLGALPVAFLVWSIGLSLGGTTGYAINPARDLGPRIVHAFLPIKNKASSNWGYAWIPVLGPIVGACLAAAFMLALS
ncbi:MAG: aquaporin family protein [Flavobacteriales bacterium]|nr:aquaporin family protein [Flavobacteriia bacterium]NCP89515.1 aquaporin family protein [Flavobacteriales bacterium]PIV94827.1 MAG: aquaporin [Flavobacteriaceae bacterium CG17_big_fil_post_rev_8_21_14_2_50_33_15]PIY12687.1 MAG: aquaporin [Flavobacteriaceae bacterium CG_4_10_14_3_um_filter_33_47]PJB17157.1 MAG: aquaporin [Flavobacteriaceae bacterium CG_4_9_14_3_um_filter_33_16]